MANFYWRGQRRDTAQGLSAFDFNEPSNWVTFETATIDEGCRPYTTYNGKVYIDVQPNRGVGIENYGLNEEGSGFGWAGASNVCRLYSTATRAPGPGDVVVVGDDYPMGMTPLLFGGFQGGATGGVWINGADDGNGGYTNAYGTTTDSSLAAFYYGGLGLGHPDFNYPWQRIGGGFTANAQKYGPYSSLLNERGVGVENFADQLWKYYFIQGGTYIVRLPGGATAVKEVAGPIFSGVTWTNAELTERTKSLSIKADLIEEAVRNYTGAPQYADLNVIKNVKPNTDPITGTVYNKVVTKYVRYSRNTTSFLSGYFYEIQNKPADTKYRDWNGGDGLPLDDETHDVYYLTPNEVLVIDGVTAGSIRSYIPDQIKITQNTIAGSVHIDDNFTVPTDVVYCLNRTRRHIMQGKINTDRCLTDLGLTGTAEGSDLDNTFLVRARTQSFVPVVTDALPGAFEVLIGNNEGLTGITCDVQNVNFDITQTLPTTHPHYNHRPSTLIFQGTGPIISSMTQTKWTTIFADNIAKETNICIGVMKLGEKTWFYPNYNNHANWFFGVRYTSNPGNFLGGIQFLQEANASDSDLTSEFVISPYFRLHNSAVGLTLPSGLVGPSVNRGKPIAEYISSVVGNPGA